MKSFFGLVSAGFMVMGLSMAGIPANAQAPVRVHRVKSNAPAAPRPVTATTALQSQTTSGAAQTTIVSQTSSSTHGTQTAKVVVRHRTAPATTKKASAPKAAFQPGKIHPNFAGPPTVVNSVNFGNAQVAGTPVMMTLTYPATPAASIQAAVSTTVPNGGTAPGAASDYIFFGNSNVEFGQQGGGQPVNLTNFTVSTLSNVEYPGNGSYTKVMAPGGTTAFTTGTVTENPTNYPNTTPHTQLLATFSPLTTGSFAVYILDGNTDGVVVGNSSVGLGVNGGTAVVSTSHFLSGTNEFTQFNVTNASPTDVFQVYATTSVNNYPTIGGLTFVPEAPNPLSTNLTAAATANIDFSVTDATCNTSTCTANVTFTPRFPGLAYDSISLTDSSGNLVYQTYVYGTGLAPQFGYELGNETDFTNYVSGPMGVAIGPDERLYYTSSGSNTIFEFARDFSSSSTVTLDGLASPSGIVVDGSNTLYVADQTNNIIISYTAAGVQGTVATTSLSGPSQLAIDGTGALYIADTGNGRVIKIDNQGNETTIASGLVSPVGVAVDSAGDVFYTNEANSNGQIYELRAGDTTAFAFQPQINQTPGYMAVDASGSVFLETDQGLNIFRAGNQIQYSATGADVAYGIAIDRNGDLLFTNPLRDTFNINDRSGSNFILNAPPGTQTSGTVTISNTGNEPLNFSNFTVTGPQYSVDSSNNACAQGGPLAPNTTCTVLIDFTPPEAQRYTDTLIVTSNSLNAPGTTDPFSLAGNGDGDSSTTTLTASPNPVASGSPVTVYITVTDSSAQYTPMGSITIMDGGSVLGTADLSAGTLAGTSTAHFTIPTLDIGDHDISAAFPGDLAVSPSTSNDVTVTATDGPPPFNGGISVDSQNFGTVAIGQSVTMSISGTPARGSLSLANENDFDVSIDGCSDICHYQITFNPQTPGLRTDLVSVYDDEGELEGQVYVYGIGSGPQLGFDPHPDLITQGGGIVAPTGIAIGQDGEQYTTDPGTNQVFATGGGSTVTLQILNLGKPAGIAVDAGNIVYVADQKNNLIVTYNVNSRVQGSVTTSQLNQPTGVAVDGAGDLFITDKGNNRILKIDNQGTETVLATDSVQSPRGIALDSAGDVFYTDDGNGGEIIKLPAAGGSPVSIASSLGAVRGIAVDAAGVIYYASGTGLNLFGPAGNTLALNFASAVDGVTLDSDGDIYLTVPASSEYVESVRYQAAYSYGANVGTSTPGTRAISNIGNTPLTISDLSITGPPFTFDSSSQCAVGTVLSPALSCNTVVDFTPFTTGESTGTATVTSDSLNEPGSTNAIQYFGTANGNSGTNVTVTGLTVSSNSVTKGHPVIFTVTVADTLTPATPPTGTVDFFNDGSYIGTATLPFTASGSAATLHFTTSSLPLGTSPITAQYFGDSNFQGSTSMVQNVTVTQPPPPVASMQNFGSVAVGQTVTGTVTFAGGGTPSFHTSNTEDFKITGYSCNSSCVVSVSFTPIFPGSRTDAIYEYDTYGNAVAEDYVYGTGTGPLFGFNPGNSALDSTWESPNGIAVSQAGVAYLSDTATNQVFVLASNVPPLPIQNLGTPGSVAVDGGGTVYVVDQTNNVIVTYNQGTQLQGSVTPTSPLSNPAEIAVDGAGSLYIADQGNNRIVKINNQGVQSSVAIGLSSPTGVAVDAAGNVYYADSGSAGEIVEVPVNGDPIVRLGTSLGSVLNITLDASGSVYYTGSFSGIRIITPSRTNFGFTGELTGNLNGIAIGPNGDIYTTQQSSGYEEQLSRATINFFTSTQVGVPVQHGGPQVFNAGNTPLTISSLALASGTVFTVDSGSICQNGLVLAPGGLCNTFVNFLPNEVQDYSDTLTFTSNSNNVAGSTNQDSETGEGTPHFFIGSRTALAVSSNSITTGQSVTLTATVTIESDVPQSTPTGTVNFFDGATQIGSGALTATGTVGTATASFVASSLAIGSHSITAMYGGDSSYSASTSSEQTVVVAAAGTTPSKTQLFVPTNLVQGQSFNIQGYVTAQSGSAAPNPTGTVTFFDGSTAIGSGSVSPNGPVGTSSASINASPLSVGTHSITATYSGDSTYASNTSSATTVTVSAPPPTTYNSVNFGSVAVGQTVQMNITFSQGVNYFIRGVNDPEFTDAGGVCNTTCTMTYNFTPKYPGLREYALSVYDQGFNLVARTYMYGTGTGPQFGFDFSTDNLYSEIQKPAGIALGPDGVAYVTDLSTNQVYSGVAGSTTALPITGLANPVGVAVDGVSKVYVVDQTNNAIVTYDPILHLTSGGQSTLTTSQLSSPSGVAVDATGGIYITDTGNNRIIKVDNQGNETTVASGVANLGPIIVDSAGDVYYAVDASNGGITELPAGGGAAITILSNISSIRSLGVDASGRVYYVNNFGVNVIPPPSCTGCPPNEALTVAGLSFGTAYGLTLSPQGDVYVTAPLSSQYRELTRTQQTGFFETSVGNSNLTPVLISNTGNAPLTLSAFSFTGTVFTVDPSSTCAVGTVIAAGRTCTTQIKFQPAAMQGYDEQLTVTSNSLNNAGSTNVFEADGQGDNPPVGTEPSTTTLAVSSATITAGQTETLTATVTGGSNPTGTVTFFDGSTSLGIGTIVNSVATLAVSNLAVGTHQITATYNGDVNYARSTSAPMTVTVTAAPVVVNSLNLGNVAVGQSVSMNMTYPEGTNPTISAVNNLDFVVSTVNCSTSCVATISFTPQYPGTRDDAVLVTDSNGNVLAKTFVYGTGTAGQFGFLPGSSSINTSFTFPTSITFDAAGIGYLTDAATDKVYPLVTDAQALPIAGLGKPGGIALDGSGTFYIADKDNNRIVTYNRNTNIQGVLATSQVNNPGGVAVDGTGAVYIADTGNNRIIRLDNQGVETTVASANTPQAVAVDSANNLYYSDLANNGEIIELPAAGGSPITLVQFVGATPLGVAVDASGSIYYVGSNFSGIRDVLPGGANNGQIAFSDALTGGHSGLALNANGDIWTMQSSNGVLETLHRATAVFTSTTPIGTPKQHTVQVVNTGNAPLTISNLAFSDGTAFSLGAGSPCAPGTVLLPASECDTYVVFNPPAAQTYTSFLNYTSDTLNVAGSVTTDGEVGTGTGSPATSTTTALTLSSANITAGQTETLTATITGITPPVLTGTVTFYDGTTSMGSPSVTATSTGATATLSVSTLSVGSHSITAIYDGDTTHLTSSSSAQTVTVNAAPTIITSQNFGSVAVGQSATMSVVFNLASGPNFTALSGTDFSVTSSSCNTTCTATVKFTPKFPGVREDVVAVTDNSGNLLAKAYIYGIGTGPQLGFDPGMNDTFSGTIQTPAGIAVGPQSTEYITDTSTKRIWAVNGSGVNALPITGLGNPVAVAVDGGGIVYLADQVNNAIVTYDTQRNTQGTLATSGLSSPNGVAVDGAGNVYISDLNNNRIVEISNQGAQSILISGLTSPQSIAVDSSGDVFYADLANGSEIKERTVGGSTIGILITQAPIHGLALDASGKLYYTDDFGLHTYSGGVFNNYGTSLSGTVTGVAVGPEGNIYVAEPSTGTYVISVRGTSQAYPTASAGSSAQTPFILTNTGNAPLTISNITFTAGTPYALDPLSDCAVGSVVAAGQNCSESIDFTPTAAQTYNSVMTVTSNNLNVTGAQNVFSIFGTGTASSPQTSTTTLTAFSNNVTVGGDLLFSAKVVNSATTNPTGSVTLYMGTTVVGSQNVMPAFGTPGTSTAGFVVSNLPAGTYTFTASYAGDTNVQASTSSPVTVTVSRVTTSTSLSVSAPTITAGQAETLTATVSGQTLPTMGGAVTFFEGTRQIGQGNITATSTGGTATYTTSSLAVGTHNITATYNGDTNYTPSTSTAQTVTVNAPTVVVNSQSFGSLAVGQSASMTLNYAQGSTVSATYNLDFAVSSSTCGTSCTATVSFTPQYPGQREDAIIVKDANGYPIAKTFVYGTGTAPQFAFDIGLQTTPITYGSSGTPGPIAVGPDGTYYVADTTNNQVKAFANNGFATLNVGTIGTPAGLAVDGAGTVYVSDPAHNRVVYETNGVPGVVPVTFSQPSFLATDGAGSLYVLDNGFDHIVKIDNQGNQTIIGTTPQASAAGGIAVDASGNVFFVKANGDNSAVTEVGVSTTPALNVPIYAIAVDAADRLYLSAVDDATNHSAVALLSPGATAAVNYPISSSNALPPDIEVDQAGRILVSEPSIGQVDIYDRSSGNISSLTASVGSSAQATVTVSNTGNTPLVLSQLAIASNGFTIGTGGTCTVGGSVAPAGTCTVVVTFAPAAAQTYQGTLTIVSNSLNSTQSSNQFTLSGQGQSTGQTATSATLQLSAANITVGQTETLTANITGGPTPALTGAVTFYDGLTSLGSNPVTATSTGATASLSVSNLAVGSHQITASYSGDSNYFGTTTEASTVTVASPAGPVVTSLNFGNVAVGQSTSMNVVYAVGANPIIRAAENHEFRVTTINCDTSCTATITFTPQYPGLRNDLVTVKNGNGDVLAKTYVYGIGTGPQFGFDPGTSSVFTNIQQPTGIAVDVFGARYISDQATNQVFLVSDGTSALPITGLGKPAGVAVDGGEKVYIADQTNNVIVTYDQNAGRQGTVATTQLSSPTNIAVDGTGALYIVDAGNNRIIKIDNQGNETTLVSDVSSLGAIALDSAGDVYYSITGSPGSITELPVGGGQPIGIANNIGDIHGLAVDASNRVYYTNDAGLSIIPLPSCGGCFLEGLRNTGTGDSSYGIALGPDGNIFLTSPSTSTYALQNRATGAGSVTANVGSSVQQDPFIVSNTGNAPLTISSIAIDATAFAVDPTSGCAAGTVLTPGSICNTVVDFMPSAAATYRDPLVFTSNSLNVVGSQNVFSETGTGTGTAPLTPSTTTLAVTPSNNVTVGQSVTLTATVTETTNIPPSGTVNFLDGATVIGSSFLQERASGGTSTASFTASSLAVGSHSITAMYAGDSNFLPSTSAAQTVTVTAPVPAPTLASISPTGGVVGSAAKTVTLTGTNFSTSDVVQLNGATISSTFVNTTTLTAVLPASFFGAAGTGQITVFDPVGGTTTAAQPFVVIAAPTIQFSGPTTGAPAQQPTLTFTLTNPYPFPIAGTLTLAFAPAGALPVDDPSIQFSSGGRTIAFAIPALSTTTPVVQLQTGTVAGKVTVTLDVTSNGVDVTPANVTPVVINIPAIAPSITTAAVTRSGNTLSVVIQGFSNTRELSTAMFHFTAADGSSISTPDITAQVGTVFATWFASAASAQYGSAFTYTQEFNLNNDASTVGTVTVTLVNSIGTSSQGTAQ